MPYNFSKGLGGGAGGAATGATIGSAIFPGVGTAVGAGVGLLTGILSGIEKDPEKEKAKSAFKSQKEADKYFGKFGRYPAGYEGAPLYKNAKQANAALKAQQQAEKYFKKFGKYPAGYVQPGFNINSAPAEQPATAAAAAAGATTPGIEGGYQTSPNLYSPEQQNVLNYLLSQGKTQLENPYGGFEPIEQQARSKFQSESLPSIAERFSALGGSDTRYSSDLTGSLAGAQSEFDQGIAALRAQYGLENQGRALDLLRMGLTPQTEQHYFPAQPPLPQVPSTGERTLEAGTGLLSNYLQGGGDFGISQILSDRKAKKQQETLVNQILNKNKIGTANYRQPINSKQSINNFARLLAYKRLQKVI